MPYDSANIQQVAQFQYRAKTRPDLINDLLFTCFPFYSRFIFINQNTGGASAFSITCRRRIGKSIRLFKRQRDLAERLGVIRAKLFFLRMFDAIPD